MQNILKYYRAVNARSEAFRPKYPPDVDGATAEAQKKRQNLMDELKSDDEQILNLALQSKWDALMATTAPYIKDAMNEEAYAEFEKEQYYICMEAAFAGRSEQKYVYEPRLPPRSEEEKMLVGRVAETQSKAIDALIIQEWQKT